MAKSCETFEHTADVGLSARGESLAELFEALAEGLAEVICPRGQVVGRQRRPIAAKAEDVEALAVDFLGEVMIAIQTDRFAVAGVDVERIDAKQVSAVLTGEPLDPARHEIDTEVKAVTYHQLEIARRRGAWVGRVILDV